jgi:hypothetical protein
MFRDMCRDTGIVHPRMALIMMSPIQAHRLS